MRLKRLCGSILNLILAALLISTGSARAHIVRIYDVGEIPELLRLAEQVDGQRVFACGWLGRLGWGNEEVALALNSMLNDTDSEVRLAAASGIGKLGPVALPYREGLRRLQQGDSEVGFAASVSLCQLEDSSLPLGDLKSLPVESFDRTEALDYLAWLGPRAQPALPLLQREFDKEDDYLRMKLARCIWCIDGDKTAAVTRCTEFINTRSERYLVTEAIGILHEVDPDSAALFLAQLPGLIRDETAVSAAMRLAVQLDYSSPEVLAALLDQCANPEAWVRQEAAESLATLIRQPDEQLARRILHRLGSLVIEMFSVSYGGEKYSGLPELCRSFLKAGSGQPDLLWSLNSLLQVDDAEYCRGIISGLDGDTAVDDRVLTRLLEFAQGPDQGLSQAAIKALGRLGPAAAATVPELRGIRDNRPEIAWEVAQALFEITKDENELLDYAKQHLRDSKVFLDREATSSSEPLLEICESRSAVPQRSRPVLLDKLRQNPTALDPSWVRRLMLWGVPPEEYFPSRDSYLDWLKSLVEQEPKKYTMEGFEFVRGPRRDATALLGNLAADSPAAADYLLQIVREDDGSAESLAQSCGSSLSDALALAGPAAAEAIPWLESELASDWQASSISAAHALLAIGGDKEMIIERLEFWSRVVEAGTLELWFDRTLKDSLGEDAARLRPILEQRWRWEKPWNENEVESRRELISRLAR